MSLRTLYQNELNLTIALKTPIMEVFYKEIQISLEPSSKFTIAYSHINFSCAYFLLACE